MSRKMFIWENVGGLTESYHDGGGVLVIAGSLDAARERLKADNVKKDSEVFSQEPSYSVPVDAAEDTVIIFPDAGCC